MANRNVKFDVMLNDRFVCTLNMELAPHRIAEWIAKMPVLKYKAIQDYVEQKRPSLRGNYYRIEF
jgi:hypothetical protein